MMYVSTASVCTVGLHVPGPNVSRRSSMGMWAHIMGMGMGSTATGSSAGQQMTSTTYVVRLVRTGRRTDD